MSEPKIIRLTADNIKRLIAVEIKPDGNMVIIAGKNAAGKTSVLDAVQMALGGAESIPSKPVRHGQEKARIEIDLGDLIVKRTFTAAGGTALTVTNKDGAKYPSPQAILDRLVGKLSFDPLEFTRQKSSDQSDTIRQLVGLDFTKQDGESAKLYDERTVVNRELKSLESRLVATPTPKEGLPEEEQSTAAILEEQQKASAVNAENEKKRAAAKRLRDAVPLAKQAQTFCRAELNRFSEKPDAINDRAKARIAELQAEIQRVEGQARFDIEASTLSIKAKEQELAEKNQNLIDADQAANKAQEEVTKITDIDLAQFSAKLQEVETVNRDVRSAKERSKLSGDVDAKRKSSGDLTTKIDAIETGKQQAIQAAKFPVEGLSMDASGAVIFNGIPFSQASAAEQLRVSVAIGLALNPKLKVLLIRDGSLLDEDNLKLLAEQAAVAEAQIWLEVVSTDGNVSVIIEDGMVKAQ